VSVSDPYSPMREAIFLGVLNSILEQQTDEGRLTKLMEKCVLRAEYEMLAERTRGPYEGE